MRVAASICLSVALTFSCERAFETPAERTVRMLLAHSEGSAEAEASRQELVDAVRKWGEAGDPRPLIVRAVFHDAGELAWITLDGRRTL